MCETSGLGARGLERDFVGAEVRGLDGQLLEPAPGDADPLRLFKADVVGDPALAAVVGGGGSAVERARDGDEHSTLDGLVGGVDDEDAAVEPFAADEEEKGEGEDGGSHVRSIPREKTCSED